MVSCTLSFNDWYGKMIDRRPKGRHGIRKRLQRDRRMTNNRMVGGKGSKEITGDIRVDRTVKLGKIHILNKKKPILQKPGCTGCGIAGATGPLLF